MSIWELKDLAGKLVAYRVRWSDEMQYGRLGRFNASILWIGCACLHHNDIVSIREES